MIYPWQVQEWQKLLRAKEENRLPHAILLSGLSGIGKAAFALHFASFMLCKEKLNENCTCQSCHLIKTRAHPNVLWVEPEKKGQMIRVDQIRAVSDFVNQSSFQGEYRLVLIHPADNMNANAANALLKTLEEPASGSIIILINHQLNALPATILSRCQRLFFAKPAEDKALAWLKEELKEKKEEAKLLLNLAQGAPLFALKLLEDENLAMRKALLAAFYELSEKNAPLLKLAANFQEGDSLLQIDFMLSFILDLAHLQLGDQKEAVINIDFLPQLSQLKEKIIVKNTLAIMTYLQQLRRQIQAGFNLNKQLMMESIFIRWLECF